MGNLPRLASGQWSTQAVGNPGLAQVVRRHLQPHAISDGKPDEMFAHFTGKMGQNLVLIVQFDPKHCARQYGRDSALQLDRFFTAHAVGREPKRSIISTRRLAMCPG